MIEREWNLADPAYVKDQYQASGNLDARIALHERFSTHTQDWHAWVFDHLDLPSAARVLEIGCGTGLLWTLRENRARIPATWHLTLSDFSFGMVETTRATGIAANLLQSDAQAIPFHDGYFDVVIANHMLYHVPDVLRAIAEIRRVLKPSGTFYAATNGLGHMRECFQWVSEFLGMEPVAPSTHFTLENGAAQLDKHFARVQRVDYGDSLRVTQVEPLFAFIMSGFMGKQMIGAERASALRQFIADRIVRDGAFRITKSTGLFIANGA